MAIIVAYNGSAKLPAIRDCHRDHHYRDYTDEMVFLYVRLAEINLFNERSLNTT